MKSTPTLRSSILNNHRSILTSVLFLLTRVSYAAVTSLREITMKHLFLRHSFRNLNAFNACALAFLVLTMPIAPFAAATRSASLINPRTSGERNSPVPSKAALKPNAAVSQNAPLVATVTATLADDIGLGAKKNPGDTITYTAIISDAGTDATGVTYTDNLNANVTQTGTVNVSPVTLDDTFPVT